MKLRKRFRKRLKIVICYVLIVDSIAIAVANDLDELTGILVINIVAGTTRKYGAKGNCKRPSHVANFPQRILQRDN